MTFRMLYSTSVSDMMGAQKGWDVSSIGVLAEALQEGILNLQLYLDTKDQRQKLMLIFNT